MMMWMLTATLVSDLVHQIPRMPTNPSCSSTHRAENHCWRHDLHSSRSRPVALGSIVSFRLHLLHPKFCSSRENASLVVLPASSDDAALPARGWPELDPTNWARIPSPRPLVGSKFSELPDAVPSFRYSVDLLLVLELHVPQRLPRSVPP